MTPRRLLVGCGLIVVVVIALVLGVFIAPLVHISISAPPANGSNGGGGGNTTIDTNPPTGITAPPGGQTVVVNVSCGGYVKTGPGNTQTYTDVKVDNGCVMVVQGVSVNINGSYNWNNGGAAGVGPGSYSMTITDGAYQITTTSGGQALWCNTLRYLRNSGSADSFNQPLSGWSSNC